jgi:hypothetical protein
MMQIGGFLFRARRGMSTSAVIGTNSSGRRVFRPSSVVSASCSVPAASQSEVRIELVAPSRASQGCPPSDKAKQPSCGLHPGRSLGRPSPGSVTDGTE